MAERTNRRLAAIIAADVAGYSRLVAHDEEGTVRALRAHRSELIDPLIEEHGGRIANTAGDSLLIEFPSAVDATRCAVAIQRGMHSRNIGRASDRRIEFRIGINVGDVIVEGNDLMGDGVNVAARLESLADPNGICLSRAARDQVYDKVEINLEDLGDVEVKNIPQPISTFRVVLNVTDGGSRTQTVRSKKSSGRPHTLVAGLVATVVVGAAALAVWWSGQPDIEPASIEAMADPLPDKPSIAVLPFANMSDDPQQAYLADGITEDLITDLAKLSGLFVISRNSVFTYKEKPVKIRQVAEELSVRYVLRGSVRRFNDELRITGDLFDATSGRHIWAESYDGTIENVFAFQDDVRGKIVASLEVTLTKVDAELAANSAGTQHVEAYEHYLRAMANLHRAGQHNVDPLLEARTELELAIGLDPDYGRAYAALAWCDYLHYTYSGESWGTTLKKIIAAARQSLEREETAYAYIVMAKAHFRPRHWRPGGDHDPAIRLLEKALQVEPGNPDVMAELAHTLAFAGDPERALELMKQAERLNPNVPVSYRRVSGIANFLVGNYTAAVADLRVWRDSETLHNSPVSSPGSMWLAAAQAMNGQIIAAQQTLAPILNERGRDLTGLTETAESFPPAGTFKNRDDREPLTKGLVAAGMRPPQE